MEGRICIVYLFLVVKISFLLVSFGIIPYSIFTCHFVICFDEVQAQRPQIGIFDPWSQPLPARRMGEGGGCAERPIS